MTSEENASGAMEAGSDPEAIVPDNQIATADEDQTTPDEDINTNNRNIEADSGQWCQISSPREDSN